MSKFFLLSAAVVAASAGSAIAQINGFYKPAYGQPVSVQQIGTHFGNSTSGNIQAANGSELNAAFAFEAGGNLNLLLTGNLEANFNKMVIFVDNGNAGGFNVLPNVVAGLPDKYNGMTLDQSGVNGASATFRATHWLSVTCGGGPFGMFVDGGDLLSNTGGFLGGNDGQSGGALSGGTNVLNALVALDNSNVAGVDGNPGAAQGFNALTAFSGLEVQIPLASLGVGTMNGLRLMAFINGANHDYLSNQFLGSLPIGTQNLGGDGAGVFTGSVGGINLNGSYAAGDQFFTLVPAPGSLGLLAIGGVIAVRRRRA
jgi:hypothetical protein